MKQKSKQELLLLLNQPRNLQTSFLLRLFRRYTLGSRWLIRCNALSRTKSRVTQKMKSRVPRKCCELRCRDFEIFLADMLKPLLALCVPRRPSMDLELPSLLVTEEERQEPFFLPLQVEHTRWWLEAKRNQRCEETEKLFNRGLAFHRY